MRPALVRSIGLLAAILVVGSYLLLKQTRAIDRHRQEIAVLEMRGEQGDVAAMLDLSTQLSYDGDDQGSRHWLAKAAESGSHEAQLDYFDLWSMNPQQFDGLRAGEYMRLAVAASYPPACLRLASQNTRIEGHLEIADAEREKYFRCALTGNLPAAYLEYAKYLRQRNGGDGSDHRQALSLLRAGEKIAVPGSYVAVQIEALLEEDSHPSDRDAHRRRTPN